MQWFLVILFVVVVGALVFVAKTMKRSASSGTVDPYTELEQGPHVRYRVPDGQDPVVVLSRLREAGYTAVPDQGSYEQSVVIGLLEDTAQARDTLRRLVAEARATNVEGPPALDPTPVRFVGETGSR